MISSARLTARQQDKFDGFQFGAGNIVFDDTLLLIEPEAAKAYEEANRHVPTPAQPAPAQPSDGSERGPQPTTPTPGAAKQRSFHGTADIPAATAKMRLVQLADEIVSVLNSDPSAAVNSSSRFRRSFRKVRRTQSSVLFPKMPAAWDLRPQIGSSERLLCGREIFG